MIEEVVVPSAHYADGVRATVLVPPGEGPFPVLFLLHGSEDDATTWVARTKVEEKADGVIVVMPDAKGRSFYLDSPGKGAWQRFFLDELLPWVDARYPVAARCVAGSSMGGYGALRLGWTAPERFVAVASMSGAVEFGEPEGSRSPMIRAWTRDLFGRKWRDPYRDARLLPLLHARLRDGRYDGPALRLDVGLGDFLLASNRRFHRTLEELGVPHTYVEPPGGHDWAYWDARVGEVIGFCRERVG